MRRNIFRGPAYANLDMSVTKRWNLSERISLQLARRILQYPESPEFRPVHHEDPSFGSGVKLGVVKATPDVGVANPVVGSGGSRHIQLGAKLIW